MNNHLEHQQENLEYWKAKPLSELDEVKILKQLQELGTDHKDAVDWHALAAGARYYRKKEVDKRTQLHLDNIFENESITPFACDIFLNITADRFNIRWFTEEFQKIRETDHSQGKIKKLERTKHQLKEAGKKAKHFETIQLQAENACLQGGESLSKQKVDQALQLLPLMNEAINEAVEDIEKYSETISGIHSSKDKKRKLTDQLQEVERLAVIWEEQFQTDSTPGAEALQELDQMTGLEEVKQKVKLFYYYLKYEKERQKRGLQASGEQSLNMILTGNPGTGKTTIARLLAKIYYQLGLLPREEVVETDRSRLVGAYVGQTEEKTLKVIEEAAGGVLFIDEAHTLYQENGSHDYGQTAVDTLVAAMTSGEHAGTFAVIFAGYSEEMRGFLDSNTGLRSRFPSSNQIHLPDYSMSELMKIGEQIALDQDFTLTEGAYQQLKRRLEKEQVDDSFGNARTVSQLIQEAVFYQGARTAQAGDFSEEAFTVLTEEAFQQDNVKKQPEAPMEELEQLIGLQAVKKEVKQLSSFVTVQREREKQSLPSVPVQLHSLFTGPPGTGKTTVAEIYSRILQELGILKRGHLIVAGRSDLVAGYSGQTALKTKKIIKQALGGVLFIDEAYALLSGSSEDFGKEAINTLVEEMTKHEENLVVILAGYEEPIKQLLKSNPGLHSRFKKHLQFPDYLSEELLEILLQYIEDFGYELGKGVKEKLERAISGQTFSGNARAVKDIAEEAVQSHAYHYLYSSSERKVSILEAEDFKILQEESDV